MNANRGQRMGPDFGPNARRRRQRARQPRAADRTGLYVLLAVAGFVGLALVVRTMRGSAGPDSQDDPSATATAERTDSRSQDDLLALTPPAETQVDSEFDRESDESTFEPEIASDFKPSEPGEPLRTQVEEVTEVRRPLPPASLFERSSGRPDASVVIEPPAAKETKETKQAKDPETPPAVAEEQNTYFTLVLSGNLGGSALTPQDAQTWARLAYALSEEAQVPHFLAYPGGRVPQVIAPKSAGKASRPTKPKSVVRPSGDPKSPAYRIVLDAKVVSAGGISFYGKQLGSRYNAVLVARVEKRVGEDFVELKTVFHSEEHTPGASGNEDVKNLARKLYDVALESLAHKLVQIPLLRGSKSAGA